MVTPVFSLTRKGHSDFISIRKSLLTELAWRRGDQLVGVIFEDLLVLKKLPVGAIADEIAGQMLRRARGEQEIKTEGAWSRQRRFQQQEP